MAIDLIDILADRGSGLELVVARVKSTSTGIVNCVVGAVTDVDVAEIKNAGHLASYTPANGDIVAVLVHPRKGALVLGKVAPR